MRARRHVAVFVAGLVIFSIPGFAQEVEPPSPSDDETAQSEETTAPEEGRVFRDQIVVTPARQEQASGDALAPITVFDRDTIEKIQTLQDWGIHFSMDDFGSGYSSLSYLKQLPIQTLKIDRSFVRDIPADPDDAAITSAIVALGHRLQMSIVAEGVETEEQLAFLAGEGCQEAQGFLVSEPLPEEEIRRLLQHGEVTFDDTPASEATEGRSFN